MADAELNIKVSTTHTQEGAAKAEAAIKTQTAAAVKGAKAATDATNKWSLSKKALSQNLTRLTKEFPLLGAAGRLALNPILLAAAGAAWVFNQVGDSVKALSDRLKELQKNSEAFHDSVVEMSLALRRASNKELAEYNKLVADTANKLPTVTEKLDAQVASLNAEAEAAKASATAQAELAKVRIEASGMSGPDKALALGRLGATSKAQLQAIEEDAAAKRIAAIEAALQASKVEMEGAQERIKAAQKVRDEQLAAIDQQQKRIEALKAEASVDIDEAGGWERFKDLFAPGENAAVAKERMLTESKAAAEKALPAQQALLTQRMSEAGKSSGEIEKETARVAEQAALRKRLQEEIAKEASDKLTRQATFQAEADAERIRRAQQKADVLLEPGTRAPWVEMFEQSQRMRGKTDEQIKALLTNVLAANQIFADNLVDQDRRLTAQVAALQQRLKYASNIGTTP